MKRFLHLSFVIILLVLGFSALGPMTPALAAGTCYVSQFAPGSNNGTSWANAYTNLQSALGNAACTEIWVAAGIYKPTDDDNRSISFALKNGVAIYGGFDGTETALSQRKMEYNITVLSGDVDKNDMIDPNGVTTTIVGNNSYHVVTATGVDSTAVLDGFVITGWLANGASPNETGGGMYNYKSNPTLANLTFSGNSADLGGGMYNFNNSNPSLSNVTFSNNSASFGGGMYNEDSSPTLITVTFSNNSADFGGGMVNTENSSPSLTNVTFDSNFATYYGGGMFNAENSGPTLTNVIFSENQADFEGGGGMYNTNSSPALTNVTFITNEAYEGGGMYNQSSSPTLTNVVFNDNYGKHQGGGMFNNHSNPTLVDVTFGNNNRASRGGGMYNTNSSPSLTSVTFTDSLAYDSGSGMYNINNSNPTLTNVTFSDNFSVAYGAGIHNISSSPTLTNVIFSNNHANSSGGGMENENNSNPTLVNVIFDGNTATYGGGGMSNFNSSPVLTYVSFNNNSAEGGGGGMHSFGGNLTLTNVTFNNNFAGGDNFGPTNGGGMHSFEGNLTLTNVTFSGNQATRDGGGMYNHTSNPTLTNVTFSGNSATRDGGGMYNHISSPTLINTIIANSTGGDCMGVNFDISSNHNLISDPATACGLTHGTNNSLVGVDPLLGPLADNGGFTHTHALLPGSPAIDAGNNASCPATDQRGVNRPQGAGCDIGAFEFGTYTVTFDAQGGTPTPGSQTISHGGLVSKPANPARACHIFTGWFTAPTGGTLWNFATDTVTIDFTLYARWKGGTFSDVSNDYWACLFIERLHSAGLTSGYPDGTYRPNNNVTRGEMAVFLLKAINGPAYNPPTAASLNFNDIEDHWAVNWIEALRAAGITGGYPDGTYRPNNNVTRGEMAVFLLKATNGTVYNPPTAASLNFSDIEDHWAVNWIEALRAEGITGGYPDGTYRPNNFVTRGEMAVFLVRTFSLP